MPVIGKSTRNVVATKTSVSLAVTSAPSAVFAQTYLYWINSTHVGPLSAYSCGLQSYRRRLPNGTSEQIMLNDTIRPAWFDGNVTEVVYYAVGHAGTSAAMFDYEFWG